MKTIHFSPVFAVILSCSILNSCSIEGVTNDFGKLNEYQKAKIVYLTDFHKLTPGVVYLVNAAQLKNEIKKYPKSIVYLFTSGCTSKYCKPLFVYENYAKKYDYKLFLVMTGFSDLDKTTGQDILSPLFAIDNKYYKSRLRNRYVRYFTNELQDKPLKTKDTDYSGSIYFFRAGKFEKVLRELPQ